MENKKIIRWKKTLTDKFPFLAGITALGYMIAYFFQVGIAAYYGYPEDFIFFDLSTLLKSIAIIYCILIIFIAPASLLSILNHKKWLYLIIGPLLGVILYYCSFGMQNPFTFFNEKTAISLIIASQTVTLPIMCAMLYFNSSRKHLSSISNLSIIAFLALTLVAAPALIGQVLSYKKDTFYQLKDKENFILLSSSGGKMVFGKCTKGEKEFLLTDTSPNLSLQIITSQETHDKIKNCFFNSRNKNQ